MNKKYNYEGDELTIFSEATNWKTYFKSQIGKYLTGNVLEVGAGLGGTLKILYDSSCSSWTCLEPDVNLIAELKNNIQELSFHSKIKVIPGTLKEVSVDTKYDTILYVDVLEHIEDDIGELQLAQRHLNNNGHLIIISPAFNWLYSDFDESIGHFRRYTKKSITEIVPNDLEIVNIFYLDFFGIFLSLANKYLLKRKIPSQEQIMTWDNYIIPNSKIFDKIIRYKAGRTIVGVLTKR